jgi:hypothetical protein
LFGRLLAATGFKRLNGLLQLTVLLPDGSPGTIRADATDVLGVVTRSAPAVVLDAAGLRELQRLVTGLRGTRRVRPRGKTQIGSSGP